MITNMETTSKDKFHAIMQNGTIVSKDRMQSIFDVPRAEYYLHAVYEYTFKTSANTTDWYRFQFIDNSGNPITFRQGDFEVNYIDTDRGYTNFFGREIQIYDTRKNQLYTFTSKARGAKFVKEELIPLINELNHYGSWEARKVAMENTSLKSEIESYKKQIEELQLQLDSNKTTG